MVPIGTSTKPTLFTFPAKANTFVPGDFSVPISRNHSLPCWIIKGTFNNVSTLFTTVGFPKYPLCAGYGGFDFGSPLSPCIDWMSAVSSPHTKAPAPNFKSTSKEKEVPKICFPKYPFFLACSIAFCNLEIARGYSARI